MATFDAKGKTFELGLKTKHAIALEKETGKSLFNLLGIDEKGNKALPTLGDLVGVLFAEIDDPVIKTLDDLYPYVDDYLTCHTFADLTQLISDGLGFTKVAVKATATAQAK